MSVGLLSKAPQKLIEAIDRTICDSLASNPVPPVHDMQALGCVMISD